MHEIDTEVVFVPPEEALRYLPEGPSLCPDGRISWVAIQHGADAQTGSLNLLDLDSATNQSYPLPGRPGFAFATSQAGSFLVGLERSLVLFNSQDGSFEPLVEHVDQRVIGTIINDGVCFDGNLIFGCKDLAFREKKAGLYLLRAGERELVQLSSEQICSNGKVVVTNPDRSLTLYDICSASKQVLGWDLDLTRGKISHPHVTVDLTAEPVFPDGMILAPDGAHLIVAIYDPRDSHHGEARMYEIDSGKLKTVWRCPGSPRVTCPLLVQRQGRVELLLTTADEGMPPERRAKSPHAGCLFIGPTDFESLSDPLAPCRFIQSPSGGRRNTGGRRSSVDEG